MSNPLLQNLQSSREDFEKLFPLIEFRDTGAWYATREWVTDSHQSLLKAVVAMCDDMLKDVPIACPIHDNLHFCKFKVQGHANSDCKCECPCGRRIALDTIIKELNTAIEGDTTLPNNQRP